MLKSRVILITLIMSHSVIADITKTAQELYHQCANETTNGNIIISPFSISSSMASLVMGAEGNTYQQIFNGMDFNYDKTATAQRYFSHFKALKEGLGKTFISIVNQLYAQEGYAIKTAFRNITDRYFKSGIETLDFADSENATKIINSFVANKTFNKIQNLIPPDTLDAKTALVLINAIYFKGQWKHSFDLMFHGDFFINKDESRRVQFMRKSTDYQFVELTEAKAKAIELKFDESNFSLIVILPNDPEGLPVLERSFRTKNLRKVLKRMTLQCVELTLPKFKIEYDIDLQNVLNNMGMVDMFEDTANFSGILETSKPMKVSKVLHKAFIDVNEHGCEAAAATGIVLSFRMAFPECSSSVAIFNANHPFLFHIMDVTKGIVLFSGRYMNPSSDD